MESFQVERLVYDGSDPSDDWIITAIGHSKLNIGNLKLLNVESKTDYITKCPLHDSCIGHMCSTQSGVILPPQSLAVDTAVIRNDISKAAGFAFAGTLNFHKKQAKKILSDSMKAKTGRMRQGILNCHVDGSLRMVITPQVTNQLFTVYLPYYLKDKWKVARLDPLTQKYVSKHVEDGDYAIVLRPPTLVKESIQYCTVSFWHGTCVGISPVLVAALRGDFDGDEIHLYPVYSEEAISEAKRWVNTKAGPFEIGKSIYSSSNIKQRGNDHLDYMRHTTVSFNQIRSGIDPPLMAEQTRTKMEHIIGLRKRFDVKSCDENFIEDSIRGMADTNKQQLSQPIVGDMSRIARIAASCVIQQDDGMIGIQTDSEFVNCAMFTRDDIAGNAAIRGISTICAASQQSALDSHRAKDDRLPSHDMVSDMIVGSDRTLIILKGSKHNTYTSLKPDWISSRNDMRYCLYKVSIAKRLNGDDIVGCYNPIILGKIEPERRVDVCQFAIRELVVYHSLKLSDIEIFSLAILYTFKPELSEHPITTRDGLRLRRLHWVDVMMATHYSGLSDRLGISDIDICPAVTSSSSLVAGNFRLLI